MTRRTRLAASVVMSISIAACSTSSPSSSSAPTAAATSAASASPTVSSSAATPEPSTAVAGIPDPSSLPGRGRILFTIEGDGENHPVYIDQTGLHLVPTPADETRAHAAWAGTDALIFDSQESGARHIYRMNLDGTGVVQLTKGDPFQEQASIASDGSQIAYEEYVDATNQDLGLHVAAADGSNAKAITPVGEPDAKGGYSEAQLSPDGEWIVFARVVDFDGGVGGLSLIHPDGTGERELTDDALGAGYPRWSPDGSRILFSQFYFGRPAGKGSTSPVWVVDVASGKVSAMTDPDDPGLSFEADWSPDGEQIVYKYFRDGWDHNELHIVNTDGTGDTALWVSPSRLTAEAADWGP